MKSKKGQVWVETAIYTLIGLTIIAIVLSAAIPQIEKIKDREIISQTVNALNILNLKIFEVGEAVGNSRTVDLRIAKGRLEINSEDNSLIYILEDTVLELSEPGQVIKEGDISLKTEKYGKNYNIYLTINYTDFNLMYNEKEEYKVLQTGTTPYRIQIENIGYKEGITDINFNTF